MYLTLGHDARSVTPSSPKSPKSVLNNYVSIDNDPKPESRHDPKMNRLEELMNLNAMKTEKEIRDGEAYLTTPYFDPNRKNRRARSRGHDNRALRERFQTSKMMTYNNLDNLLLPSSNAAFDEEDIQPMRKF